jgi:hypothetical protein
MPIAEIISTEQKDHSLQMNDDIAPTATLDMLQYLGRRQILHKLDAPCHLNVPISGILIELNIVEGL